MDWACLKRRLTITEGHRRKVSRKENSRKTRNDVIGCIDARRWRECDWLRKAERKGTWQRNLASMRKNLPWAEKKNNNNNNAIILLVSCPYTNVKLSTNLRRIYKIYNLAYMQTCSRTCTPDASWKCRQCHKTRRNDEYPTYVHRYAPHVAVIRPSLSTEPTFRQLYIVPNNDK